MWARSGLVEAVLRPAADDLDLVVDVGLQRLARLRVRGTPSTRATVFTAKFVCSGVRL
jgi:KaiC/GvpD/RAD55 family RecA-like ATPase